MRNACVSIHVCCELCIYSTSNSSFLIFLPRSGISPPSAGHWERGAMSDVGAPQRRMRSHSPDAAQFSEVGGGYPPYHHHHQQMHHCKYNYTCRNCNSMYMYYMYYCIVMHHGMHGMHFTMQSMLSMCSSNFCGCQVLNFFIGTINIGKHANNC